METGVAYYGSRILRHVRADLADLADHGCSYVVHPFSEADLLHHRTTLAAIIQASHDAGLKAWADPWGFGGVFSGAALSLYAARYPQHQQVLSTGEPVPAACPNRPEFRAALRTWVDAVLDAGADVLSWGEPHFYIPSWFDWYSGPPDAWSCHCVACRYLYRERYGEDLPTLIDAQVREFRQTCILDFLADTSGYAALQGATNALSLGAAPDDDDNGVPFRIAAALPNIHIFGTAPYWLYTHLTVEEHVSQQTARVVEICRYLGKPAQIWLHGFGLPEGREHEVATAVEIAAAGGADYIAAWGYPPAEQGWPNAAPRPHITWDELGRAFRELRAGGNPLQQLAR